jgi:hypothetical protein
VVSGDGCISVSRFPFTQYCVTVDSPLIDIVTVSPLVKYAPGVSCAGVRTVKVHRQSPAPMGVQPVPLTPPLLVGIWTSDWFSPSQVNPFVKQAAGYVATELPDHVTVDT